MEWLKRKLIDWKWRYITYSNTEMQHRDSGTMRLMAFQLRGNTPWSCQYWSDYFSVRVAEQLVMMCKIGPECDSIGLSMDCCHSKVIATGFSRPVYIQVPGWAKEYLVPELEKFIEGG